MNKEITEEKNTENQSDPEEVADNDVAEDDPKDATSKKKKKKKRNKGKEREKFKKSYLHMLSLI